jgi:hypothetical protein
VAITEGAIDAEKLAQLALEGFEPCRPLVRLIHNAGSHRTAAPCHSPEQSSAFVVDSVNHNHALRFVCRSRRAILFTPCASPMAFESQEGSAVLQIPAGPFLLVRDAGLSGLSDGRRGPILPRPATSRPM